MRNGAHPRVVIDAAGAAIGGSGRFLTELDSHLMTAGEKNVQVVGRNRRLTPSWLVKRECLARRADIRIALNNASFVSPGGLNIVLLRNVLHFASRTELERHDFSPSLELRAQVPIIRGAARCANRIVVPTSAMAARVALSAPFLETAIEVRGHPVSQRSWAGKPGSPDVGILVPIVPSPYKHLDSHVAALLHATGGAGFPSTRVTVTADVEEMPLVANHPRVNFIGRIPADILDRYWQDSLAIYYPTTLEAFGYPLAEARANGRHVIAQNTVQNKEVAGDALCAFVLGDDQSLTVATRRAISAMPPADGVNNNPSTYFRWLLEGVVRQT